MHTKYKLLKAGQALIEVLPRRGACYTIFPPCSVQQNIQLLLKRSLPYCYRPFEYHRSIMLIYLKISLIFWFNSDAGW
jgi:hypothetical protein